MSEEKAKVEEGAKVSEGVKTEGAAPKAKLPEGAVGGETKETKPKNLTSFLLNFGCFLD